MKTIMSETKAPVNPLGQNFYYPSLDGLRFFAFLLVFLHHSLLNISSGNPMVNYFLIIIQKNGWVGVDLFFILSGFLITTLLLKERELHGKFSLKNFWIRRSLRIWPLYYLALIMGFFIIPYLSTALLGNDYSDPKFTHQIKTQLPLYFSFLGNWAVSFTGYGYFTNIAPLWTISLEEQFYFFWPIVLLFITNMRRAIFVGVVILLASIVTRFYLSVLGIHHPGIYTNTFARIDILTFGALLALVYFYKPYLLEKIKPIFTLPFQLFAIALFSYLLYKIYLFNPEATINVIFGYLLIGIVLLYFVVSSLQSNTKLSHFLKFKPFVELGKISYGLYIWHLLAINTTALLFKNTFISGLFPLLALCITIILGFISYYFYEVRFLKLKEKFSKIKSRPI